MARHRHAVSVRTDGLAAVLGPLLSDPRIRSAALIDVDSGMVLDVCGPDTSVGRFGRGRGAEHDHRDEVRGAAHAELVRIGLALSPGSGGVLGIVLEAGPDRHVLHTVADPHGGPLALSIVVRGPDRVVAKVRKRLRAVSEPALTAGPSVAVRPGSTGWTSTGWAMPGPTGHPPSRHAEPGGPAPGAPATTGPRGRPEPTVPGDAVRASRHPTAGPAPSAPAPSVPAALPYAPSTPRAPVTSGPMAGSPVAGNEGVGNDGVGNDGAEHGAAKNDTAANDTAGVEATAPYAATGRSPSPHPAWPGRVAPLSAMLPSPRPLPDPPAAPSDSADPAPAER